MIGVTIGSGEGWRELAEAAAVQMGKMTGLECFVIPGPHGVRSLPIPEVVHPSWLKCHVLEMFPKVDEFLVFDADILPMEKWDPAGLFKLMGRAFCAVPEDNWPSRKVPWDVSQECARYRLPWPDWYVNGGLLMFGREHAEVWKKVWGFHPGYGTWLEQTALNEALMLTGVEVVRLPRRFNRLLHGELATFAEKGVINFHADSMGLNPAGMIELQKGLFAGKRPPGRLALLEQLPKESVGAEIGVFKGDFAAEILRVVDPELLYLVDRFEGLARSGDVNGQNIEELDMGKAYRELADRFADMPTVRVKSDGAAWLKMIGDGKPGVLDWVYIDTDHEYETLRQELHEARRAVKEDGLICGHDYAREFPGVIEAVNEFAMEYGLKVQLYAGDRLPSFKIVNTKKGVEG